MRLKEKDEIVEISKFMTYFSDPFSGGRIRGETFMSLINYHFGITELSDSIMMITVISYGFPRELIDYYSNHGLINFDEIQRHRDINTQEPWFVSRKYVFEKQLYVSGNGVLCSRYVTRDSTLKNKVLGFGDKDFLRIVNYVVQTQCEISPYELSPLLDRSLSKHVIELIRYPFFDLIPF